ncbi:hypothetical protein QQS21_003901 [Conoideocrella luteorostrata]|uniref:Uncharacterized protein n=1 Tax=Conoideocrella luteorostrata TaxID=1105319 RepID=A0AAJ0G074_9HYPO|nr:hypothetical protein QQS21_003901 [Conoideocrella luteorostrata]
MADSQYQVGSRCKEVPWYEDALVEIDTPARDLLENYSRYAAHEVVPSVNEMRDQIWDVYPWPCVGGFRFLDLALSRQDLRKYVGLEVQREFIHLAYKLFRDGDGDGDGPGHLKAHFVAGDLFDRAEPQLLAVQGTFGIVNMGQILHIWDREGQLAACRRVVELLRPEPGSIIVGQCVGHLDGVESHGSGRKGTFQHNVETFRSMWDELSRQTGTSWEVHARLEKSPVIGGEGKRNWSSPSVRRLVFSVERR